jgi:hypothetical protein
MADATLAPVRRIAAFGLGSDEGAGPPLRISGADASTLVRVLARQQLIGIAVAASQEGWLDLPEHARDELLDAQRSAMMWALDLERRLLRLSRSFDAAGVSTVVLKGSALAHAIYPDPSWRPFADLDVLVRTADWRLACDVLHEAGFTRNLPEPHRGFDERFGKAASHSDETGHQVDLHRTLVLGPYGFLMDPDELFGRTSEFALGGAVLRRLDDTAALIHACLHASLGAWPPMPLPLRDVLQVARSGAVEWDALFDLASRWRVLAVVAHAMRSSARWLDVAVPERAERIASLQPNRADRRLLEAYTRGRRRGGMALATIPHIPSMRGRASYIRALLVPDRGFLAARSSAGGRPSYLQRWSVPVGWLTSRRRGER